MQRGLSAIGNLLVLFEFASRHTYRTVPQEVLVLPQKNSQSVCCSGALLFLYRIMNVIIGTWYDH